MEEASELLQGNASLAEFIAKQLSELTWDENESLGYKIDSLRILKERCKDLDTKSLQEKTTVLDRKLKNLILFLSENLNFHIASSNESERGLSTELSELLKSLETVASAIDMQLISSFD
jgi:hypothetical protein